MRILRVAFGTLVLAAALVALAPAAHATAITAHVDGLFVVGNQVFDGGEIVIRSVGSGLIAVVVNGRQVALLHRQDFGSRPNSSRPHLVFHIDDQGLPHLAAVRFLTETGASTALITFRVAALTPGLLTLPYSLPEVEPTLLAAR